MDDPEFTKTMLKEIEIANAKVGHYDDLVWRTFPVVGFVAVSPTVWLLANKSQDLVPGMAWVAGAVLMSTILVWWGMACRWWEVQQAYLCRLKAIEVKVGMFLALSVTAHDQRQLHWYQKKGVKGSLSWLLFVTGLSLPGLALMVDPPTCDRTFLVGWVALVILVLEVFVAWTCFILALRQAYTTRCGDRARTGDVSDQP